MSNSKVDKNIESCDEQKHLSKRYADINNILFCQLSENHELIKVLCKFKKKYI